MLVRVVYLRHIGRFTEFEQKAPQLGKLALLFARNAYGKTTLCAVLRSVSSQDPGPINERAHLGKYGAPVASIEFSPSGITAFKNGSWDRTSPPLLVFDSEFVRQNIHTAEEVTRDNKRQLLRLIVGSAGVALAEEIRRLDDQNTQLNGDIRAIEQAIKAAHPCINNVADYVGATVPADVETLAVNAEKRLLAARRTSEVRARASLEKLSIAELLEDYIELVGSTIEGADSKLESQITEHIAKHQLEPNGRRWISYGVERLSSSNDCPFCDQPLAGSPIVGAFKLLFAEAYNSLLTSLEEATGTLTGHLAEDTPTSIEAILERNAGLFAFWNQVGEMPQLYNLSTEDMTAARAALQQLLNALRLKQKAPLDTIALGSSEIKAAAQAREALTNYNSAIDAANAAIGQIKLEQKGEDDAQKLRDLQSAADKWNALTHRDKAPIKDLCEQWRNKTAEKATVSAAKSRAQDSLRDHVNSTADAYEASINDLLQAFGANFRLCQTKASYVGKEANTEYCIDVNGHLLRVGEAKKNAEPSFKTVLSSGDKSALALAFFLSQVHNRADLSSCQREKFFSLKAMTRMPFSISKKAGSKLPSYPRMERKPLLHYWGPTNLPVKDACSDSRSGWRRRRPSRNARRCEYKRAKFSGSFMTSPHSRKCLCRTFWRGMPGSKKTWSISSSTPPKSALRAYCCYWRILERKAERSQLSRKSVRRCSLR